MRYYWTSPRTQRVGSVVQNAFRILSGGENQLLISTPGLTQQWYACTPHLARARATPSIPRERIETSHLCPHHTIHWPPLLNQSVRRMRTPRIIVLIA